MDLSVVKCHLLYLSSTGTIVLFCVQSQYAIWILYSLHSPRFISSFQYFLIAYILSFTWLSMRALSSLPSKYWPLLFALALPQNISLIALWQSKYRDLINGQLYIIVDVLWFTKTRTSYYWCFLSIVSTICYLILCWWVDTIICCNTYVYTCWHLLM